jgi:hypothetical protein
MEEEIRYAIVDGELHKCSVMYDPDPMNPREDRDDMIGTMVLWWNRYNLGDEGAKGKMTPAEWMESMVNKHVPDGQLLDFVRHGQAVGEKIQYNADTEQWEIYTGMETGIEFNRMYPTGEADSQEDLVPYIAEGLTYKESIHLLQQNGFLFLPCYIYEHGGITISTGSFHDRFDSGQAGWIFTAREKVMSMGYMVQGENGSEYVSNENWREVAKDILEGEVEEYDLYLRDEVYIFVDENQATGEEETLGPFLSGNFGDDLFLELAEAAGYGPDVPWMDKDPARYRDLGLSR